jgi:hypothetical protein
MACAFTGPGSEQTSPRYYPANGQASPASYSIPRQPSGRVWINEVNYINDGFDPSTDTNEFVELAGPAGWNLSRWTIEFYINQSSVTGDMYSAYATYTIPNGTMLSNEISGFGFFVLGDSTVPNSDMHFTHTNTFDGTQISDGFWIAPSGIRLFNESGGLEDSICYDGPLSGFTRVPASDDGWNTLDPTNITLTGTGTYATAFTWVNASMTPGYINVGQSFLSETNEVSPPDIDLIKMVWGTNITLVTFGNTNNWNVAPYYSTNLAPISPQWTALSPFNSSFAGGTNTVWFNIPSSGIKYFYQIWATKP